jgi:hypothetical protein
MATKGNFNGHTTLGKGKRIPNKISKTQEEMVWQDTGKHLNTFKHYKRDKLC